MRECGAFLLVWATLLSMVACDTAAAKDGNKSKSPSAASVQNGVKESKLSILSLSSQAESRLGVKTAFVQEQTIQRRRLFGGQTVLPVGAQTIISAPASGRITRVAKGALTSLKGGETLYKLTPLLRPEQLVPRPAEELQWSDALVTAKANLKEISEQIKAAKLTLKRVTMLQNNKVGSVKMLEDATARLALLQATRETILARVENLKAGLPKQKELYSSETIEIVAPKGVVIQEHVVDGQQVSLGSPLVTVVDMSQLWVQLPVYVGDLERLNLSQPVRLRESERSLKTTTIRPIQGIPAANANSNTLMVFFALKNERQRFRPNQRVWVHVPLKEKTSYQTIPYSAILYDVHGQSWVYQKTKANTYVRRRVEVLFRHNDLAVIGRGLQLGMEIVTVATPELFGSEFWYR